MKREGRKELAVLHFHGVSKDGGFVFKAYHFPSGKVTYVKMTSYDDGKAEIAIDCSVEPAIVAEVAAGMFAKQSNVCQMDYIVIKYKNISLKVHKNIGRKDIYAMLMKAMSSTEYKATDNDVEVDTEVCCISYEKGEEIIPYYYDWQIQKKVEDLPDYSELLTVFEFDDEFASTLCFRDFWKDQNILIKSLRDGIVEADALVGDEISSFISSLAKFFTPYADMYGIRAVDVSFNEFSMRIDSRNVEKALDFYEISREISDWLYEKVEEEYRSTPEYVRECAKRKRAECRKEVVVQKVRDFQKGKQDFQIISKAKLQEWENCKKINEKSEYGKCIIDYTILWAQYMEYLISKHGKKVSDIYRMCSHFADIYGITGYMYGCAAGVLSSVWKYGEELRVAHNARFGHTGSGIVNPAILTVAV